MYHLITQNAREVLIPENSPARSMCHYLVQTDQSRLTNTISIYVLRGDSVEQLRLLYMNDPALKIWREMGHAPEVRETMKRPAAKSELCLGVPFNE